MRGFALFSLVVSLTCWSATSVAQDGAAGAIAKAHGASDWQAVKRIKFVWKHEGSGTERAYDWDRVKKVVTVTMGESSVTIPEIGKDLTGAELDAHKAFINDSYWLLFEAFVGRDAVTISELGQQQIPGMPGKADATAVDYGDKGYTPGDRYVLYSKAGVVQAWAYHPNKSKEPKLVTTRGGLTKFGAMQLPTTFDTPDGKRFITVSKVEVAFK